MKSKKRYKKTVKLYSYQEIVPEFNITLLISSTVKICKIQYGIYTPND